MESRRTAKQRADSIPAVVKRDKSKFEEMVKKYSETKAAQNGGVYEWFDKTRMVPEFTGWLRPEGRCHHHLQDQLWLPLLWRCRQRTRKGAVC